MNSIFCFFSSSRAKKKRGEGLVRPTPPLGAATGLGVSTKVILVCVIAPLLQSRQFSLLCGLSPVYHCSLLPPHGLINSKGFLGEESIQELGMSVQFLETVMLLSGFR